MVDPARGDNSLKEWAPLSDLFNKLPSRGNSGFFGQDVRLTCVDVLPEFIALGTNVGVVYWYDRKKKDMQRLRCENCNSPVTIVKAISTVDFMVACGNKNGNISIFQIPKSHPETLPESLKPKNKQVERYSVSELHNGTITALEWSKNGMKLFSGDKNGLIVITEIDFYMHLCKSYEVLNEAYEVVQLSYCQQNLLVSTLFRSIICQKQDKWKVTQVGKKDRKVLGKFGGVFYQNSLRPSDTLVYCTRPGLRIWESDINGSVQKTLLFKDILNKESPEVPLINPLSDVLRKVKPQKEASFGTLLPFNKDLLVTFSNDVVYVLNPKELTVISTVSNLRGILGVATSKDELFILEGERSLIRLSHKPEMNAVVSPTFPTANTFSPISSSIKEITSKIQTSTIVSAIPPFIENAVTNGLNIHMDSTSVINAEEAVELSEKNSRGNDSSAKYSPRRDSSAKHSPGKNSPWKGSSSKDSSGKDSGKDSEKDFSWKDSSWKDSSWKDSSGKHSPGMYSPAKHLSGKHSNTPIINDIKPKDIPIDELQRKLEIYNKIGEQDFDDAILYKHCRRKKQPVPDMATSISSLSSTSSEEKECSITRPTIMNLSSVGVLPDLRSPDTIQSEIEQKERLLADVLNFDKLEKVEKIGDGRSRSSQGRNSREASPHLGSKDKSSGDQDISVKHKEDKYKETLGKKTLDKHKEPLDKHKEPLDKPKEPLEKHKEPLDKHKEPFDKHKEPLDKHKEPFDKHKEPFDKHKEPLDKHKEPLNKLKEPLDKHKEPLDKHKEVTSKEAISTEASTVSKEKTACLNGNPTTNEADGTVSSEGSAESDREKIGGGSSNDIRVLAQAYPYFCNTSPNGLKQNLVSSPAYKQSVADSLNSRQPLKPMPVNGPRSNQTLDLPATLTIPSEWNIKRAIVKRLDSDNSTESLEDWELV